MDLLASGTLAVPGARLYFEERGQGTFVLLIAGGNSDAAVFKRLAVALAADHHRVVTYDPRGLSRSLLDGPPVDQRIEEHADDAYSLLCQLTHRGEPVHVFGSCSGGLVALELAIRHRDRIHSTVAHEPPALGLLPDAEDHLTRLDDVYAVLRREGITSAMRKLEFLYGGGPAPALPEVHVNTAFFLAHVLRPATRFMPDLAALAAMADQVVMAGGLDSRTHLVHRPAAVLAERLGRDLALFPGGHVGYARYPARFAERLLEVFDAMPGTAENTGSRL